MQRQLLPCVVLLLALAGRSMAHDWLIVPGERVGPVTARSTEADLRAAFGAEAVKRSQIRIDSKTVVPGLEIYNGKPGESLAVVWPRNEAGLRWPLLVIPCYGQSGADCRWRTASGVRIGMKVAELEQLNQKPFRLYADTRSKMWTHAWWSDGKLAGHLGEDVELQFAMASEPEGADQGYFDSNKEPLLGSGLKIGKMFVWLLSGRAGMAITDWTIGGAVSSAIVIENAELLRESFGADQVHRIVQQGEEGIGAFPEISVFGEQPDRSVVTEEYGEVICGGMQGYPNCRWHMPKPFALLMKLGELQKLNGRPFVFNGFDWDYGGVITSWDGGTLEKRWPHAGSYFVSCKGNYPNRMIGDGHQIRSDDPELPKLDCLASYR
jgi:hypothetical protein